MTSHRDALEYADAAETAARKWAAERGGRKTRAINSVGVIGAGAMGTGISMCFLDSGVPVRLVDQGAAALDRAVAGIQSYYERRVAGGKLSKAACDGRLQLLRGSTGFAGLESSDLLIEAVFEEMDVKLDVLRGLDDVAKPGAILASNTSMLNLDRIASATRRPHDIIGMHFFAPAQLMRLLEVVRGRETAPEVLDTILALAIRLGKTPVVSGVCDGFIGNRMMDQYVRQAHFLLEEGCTIAQVDGAMERFGMMLGPFRLLDLAGNDIGWAIRKRRSVESPGIRYSRFPDLLCEKGRFGQKVRAGYYDYPEGARDPIASAEVEDMLASFRHQAGFTYRDVEDDEIVRRLIWSLVNEGAFVLEEGIARCASDIDVVHLNGFAFPRYRGGPMYHADISGLATVLEDMRRFASHPRDDAGFWKPAPLLEEMAFRGGTFRSLTSEHR